MLVQQYSIAMATLELNACAAILLNQQHDLMLVQYSIASNLNLMLVQQYSIASATLELNACAAILDCNATLELNACAAILDCIDIT